MNNLAILKNELMVPSLNDIYELQEIVAQAEPADCQTEHHFFPGMYVREFSMPKDSVVVGAMHRYEHPLLLVKGKLTIWTDRGVETIEAPHMGRSWPGCKRVLYAHEDSVLLSFHQTDLTDLDELRKELIIDEAPLLEGESE